MKAHISTQCGPIFKGCIYLYKKTKYLVEDHRATKHHPVLKAKQTFANCS